VLLAPRAEKEFLDHLFGLHINNYLSLSLIQRNQEPRTKMVSLPDDIVAASDAAFGDTSSDDDQAANDTLASTDLAHHHHHHHHRDDEEAREDARDTDLEADHHHHHHTGQQEPSTSSIINKQLEDASATATTTTTTTSNEAQHRQSEPEGTHDPAVCPVCLITVLEGPALFKYRFHAICAVCRQCRRPLSETLGFSVRLTTTENLDISRRRKRHSLRVACSLSSIPAMSSASPPSWEIEIVADEQVLCLCLE